MGDGLKSSDFPWFAPNPVNGDLKFSVEKKTVKATKIKLFPSVSIFLDDFGGNPAPKRKRGKQKEDAPVSIPLTRNLFKCHTCNKSSSRRAAICPHCGQAKRDNSLAAAKRSKQADVERWAQEKQKRRKIRHQKRLQQEALGGSKPAPSRRTKEWIAKALSDMDSKALTAMKKSDRRTR